MVRMTVAAAMEKLAPQNDVRCDAVIVAGMVGDKLRDPAMFVGDYMIGWRQAVYDKISGRCDVIGVFTDKVPAVGTVRFIVVNPIT